MFSSRKLTWTVAVWAGVLGVYALAPWVLRNEQSLIYFGDVVQCLVPLLANAGLLMNAGTPHWRRNVFWMLLAMGTTLWMIGQFQWTYFEVYLHKPLPDLYPGDVTFFLRGVPMMAALALRPHLKRGELRLRFGYLDFVLLLTWWVFLYAYAVLPWIYASPALSQYNFAYDLLTDIQNMIIVAGLGALWLRANKAWRIVYANLFGGAVMYMLSSLLINVGISLHQYKTGSLFDLPMVGSFLWFGTAGLIASKNEKLLDAPSENGDWENEKSRSETTWASRVAMAAVITLPAFAIYTLKFSQDTREVRDFRVLATVIAAIPIGLLVFLRQ